MEYLLGGLAGIIIGGGLCLIVMRMLRYNADRSRKDLETAFSALSLEALRKNSEDFFRIAGESLEKQSQAGSADLEGKKKLIDQTLESIRENLQRVEKTITEFDKNREGTFKAVSEQLKNTAEQTGKLYETTSKLQNALANTRVRGQWGEKMADDILHYVGLIEDKNYIKNKSQETVSTRPDYTFFLPNNLKVNMDVKFPSDNYLKYYHEENESLKETYKQQFLKDTRQRIKEVNNRDYINPAENTVDYVLVFIPNEQIFCFAHENDPDLMADALKNRVILCSPLTLYAMLAVIRQSIENFSFEKTTSQIALYFREFQKQWESFKLAMEKMGKKIEESRDEYQKLISTRKTKLEKPLQQIEDLRIASGMTEMSVIETVTETDTDADDESGLS